MENLQNKVSFEKKVSICHLQMLENRIIIHILRTFLLSYNFLICVFALDMVWLLYNIKTK